MSEEGCFFLLPVSAFTLTSLLVPGVRRLAMRWGCVALPTQDRWHGRPTPFLGGAAFFLGFLLPAVVCSPRLADSFPLFLVASLLFALGAYDDLRPLNPTTKLIGQIIAAAVALFCGYSFRFFTWLPLDALLTILWIVGLTNAINLLDNMDGLAGGISLIAVLYLVFLFQQHGDPQHALLALALAGAVAAFLRHNFHPASIFMGDGGSLFLGGVLSLLTLHTQGQASNILSVVTLPTLILLVPIFDTLLVTFTRILRGQAISQGGRDHTSHRLVVLGLTESKAVLLLYLMAAISGATALLIESFSYTLSLALVPLVILSFALFTAYLAQVEIVAEEQGRKRAAERKLTTLLVTLTYKRRLFEIVLDFFLIVSAYYLAFALRFDFAMDERITALYLASIPVVLAATYSAFFFCGVYRGVWRYTDLEDLLRLAKGVAGGTLLTVAGVFLFSHFAGYSPTVFILYALLLFLSMTGSRLSFRLFTLLVARPRLKQVPVLIYGADDEGEIIVRECHKNPRLDYLPLGFLDDDLRKQGGEILGLPVLGGVEQLATVLEQKKVQGLIVASPGILANGSTEKLRVLCHKKNVWIKQLQVSFIEESEA